jgi:hypothetical protein
MHHEPDEMIGLRAAFRWLLGTDAEMETEGAREEAIVAVGEPLQRMDPFERANASLDALTASQDRLDRVLTPAKTLDEAMKMMLPMGRQ